MVTTPSLLVGSDALGWVELGGKAELGTMTKAMPGGDGSLDFTLYGDDAMKARNVLVPGDAEVRLVVGGEAVWGGVVVSDPVRHRLSCQSIVEVGCSGVYGLAGRDGRYGYIGVDTDLEQWRQTAMLSNHSGRFTVRTEGVLEIRADTDRVYAPSDQLVMLYRKHGGLCSGDYISGISFEYKCHLPSAAWTVIIYASGVGGADEVWSVVGALTEGTWTAVSESLAAADAYDQVGIYFGVDGSGSPVTDPYIRMRKIKVYGRWSDAGETTADTNLSLGDILGDLSAALGVTDTRISSTLAAYDVGQFAARFPTDVAEVMRQACALYTSPVEAFFDLDPVTLARRFTARPRPADTALAAENRLWVVGGRAGEDADGIERDWEQVPEQVTVMYAIKDDATLADGTVQVATYPGGAESTYPLAEVADLTSDMPPMTAADAGRYAQSIYSYRQSNRYTGEATLGETARDEHGVDRPTYQFRPGDRLTVLERDDTDRFGETLYVQGTAYDWRERKATVTIGSPFDPTGYSFALSGAPAYQLGHMIGRSRRQRPHVRTGIA